ncbi:uncharacterized protein LOC132793514 isoform X1 [Drosophila nasuta]|uniref:uncharacterized protein LOC132793514 isoform X1 n=1 Tax=Drosophila nasuta TaxID=42062 RepID=UPI00295E6E26|nr:uncharacterized protein LOC132793514 isoform X1 [Drosophila nasuta]
MSGLSNSCRLWHGILKKNQPQTCAKSCFEPTGQPCADDKNRTVGHVRNFLEPESPVRRLIDIKKECSPDYRKLEKTCNLNALASNRHPPNLCSSKCRPLSTSLHLKELRQRPPLRRDYKHWCLLSDGTEVGRIFPMKFRIRRLSTDCSDCNKELRLRETVTGNNDVVLLSNCCDVEIYPEKKMVNWHVVPVKMITDKEKIAKQEICVTYPPPVKKIEFMPVKGVKIANQVRKINKKKKRKKGKKGTKGKKGGKKKKK